MKFVVDYFLHQLPSIDFDPTNNNNNNNGFIPVNKSGTGRNSPSGNVGLYQHQSSEALALENFR